MSISTRGTSQLMKNQPAPSSNQGAAAPMAVGVASTTATHSPAVSSSTSR